MPEITANVGDGATNKTHDVALVPISIPNSTATRQPTLFPQWACAGNSRSAR